ncbi:NnrU family protein [Actibacterium sp. 188UL27-1]|uniref:NnrU family protein n=1 Tax=Actibacterium sp. 188UL27-1 TaxID=2786961 RepID=UPI001958B092|nr:NnrU family protein [Actibacterium sp. 188UL27-1]MBM7066548.1 NnrU family protein [Actibacterium sp. 188UL27-1]
MGFIFLILGIAAWSGAHYFKRLAPDTRARLGDPGKGLVALGIVAGLLLMIFGYRWADFIIVWNPAGFLTHINNLLMIAAVILFGMSATTGRLRGKMRHPMLASVKVWALAHLLVNGDLASILLFGGMLAWAVSEVILINRAGPWDRPAPGEAKGDIKLAVISVVVYAVIAGIHIWLGVNPFG